MIDFKELVNEKTIELYDALGKHMLTQTSTEPILKVNVSAFRNGIYLVKVVLDNKICAPEKFIIERK